MKSEDIKNIPVPCKIRCKKSYPATGESIFTIGNVYQIRLEPHKGRISIDKHGRGGIERVAADQFIDHFEVVIQVECKQNLEKGTVLFEKYGKYWAAVDEGYRIFATGGIKEVYVKKNVFSEHFDRCIT